MNSRYSLGEPPGGEQWGIALKSSDSRLLCREQNMVYQMTGFGWKR